MYHFVSENPATIVVHPLSKYLKTFERAMFLARAQDKVFVPEQDTRPMAPFSRED
jgi:hypothetical protein